MSRKHKPVSIRGFARGALVDVETGQVTVGEWHENAITAKGFESYIVGCIGGISASSQAAYLALGSQTDAPNSTQTGITGPLDARKAATNSFVANGTLRMTASWDTSEATQSNVGAVAVYNHLTTGTAASIATFATSAKTTNQTLNITYEWRFS